MKVLQINSVCGIGSTGRIATDIEKVLKAEGHESCIAYGRSVKRNVESAVKISNSLDNYMHVAKTRIFDLHGFGSKEKTKQFIKIIDEWDPDIIQLHNIHGYYINVEVLFQYLKQAKKPVVWTLHDCWPFTGHCAHFDYVKCYKWKTECYDCPQKHEYPASVLIDNSRKNYLRKKNLFNGLENLTIVTPSKWLASIVKQSFLNKYPVEVINNGIDLEVFKPTISRFREDNGLCDKFIILGVASVWGERKGLNTFCEIASVLGRDTKVVLVGLTEKQKRSLPLGIIGICRTNDIHELAGIYSAADVFVNPTLEDNFPTTNLEALACGTPIITFASGGSPESVHSGCGYIVEKNNLEELLYRINMLKENGKSEYSEKCIKISEKNYSKISAYREYLGLYKRKLERT